MAETKLNINQILLTALITCVFTVIAGVLTYFITTKQPNLTYSVASGPTLSIQGGHKRIYSIEVINSGRKEVIEGTATIKFNQGQVEDASYEASPGVTLTEDRKTNAYLLTASLLNPEEHFSVSVLASIPTPDYSPTIVVRGKGVVGTPKDSNKKDKNQIIYIVVGSAAAFLGLLTSVSPVSRKILGYKPAHSLARAFFASGSTVGPFERNELVAYILGLCSLQEKSRQIRFAPSEMSFRGAADYIVSEAIASQRDEQSKFSIALKCMLLVDRINEDSVRVIAAALKKLTGIDDSSIKALRARAINEDAEPVKLREAIAEIIQSETEKVTVQQQNPADGR